MGGMRDRRSLRQMDRIGRTELNKFYNCKVQLDVVEGAGTLHTETQV